jgi:hypothetical protein
MYALDNFVDVFSQRCGPGIIGMFEKRLKELNPNLRNITYDIEDLYEWVESLVRQVGEIIGP